MAVGAAIPALRIVSRFSRDTESPVKLRILVLVIITSRADGSLLVCCLQPAMITVAIIANTILIFFISVVLKFKSIGENIKNVEKGTVPNSTFLYYMQGSGSKQRQITQYHADGAYDDTNLDHILLLDKVGCVCQSVGWGGYG